MNKKNSLTITSAMERLEQIGTHVLECGSDVALNTNSPMKAKGIPATSTGEIQNRRSRISGVAQSRDSGSSSSKVKRLRDRQGD